MAWNDDLEAGTPAYGIAASEHTRIRVLAGPGAGKSFAMRRRVARILEVERVSPANVLAVTFTRVAAEDLHRELISLGVPGADRLSGKTIHSLAMSILMRNHVLPVLGRVPRPLNEYEEEPLLSDLSRNHGTKHARRRLVLAYGAGWARLQSQHPGYTQTPEEQAFVAELIGWLTFHDAMLMDEVVPHLHKYLVANPDAAERGEYKHVLVDEYQDLNRVEQDVLYMLAEQGSMCVIGDDDQSIYSFRYAHPDGIREWADVNTADSHEIAECRRCPTTVVRMANALIAHNTGRISQRAMVERAANGAGQVEIRQYRTPDEEADAVVTKIGSLIESGVPPREIIILAQRKTFAMPIFNRLKERGIPVKSYYAETELSTPEAQERFAIFKLFLDNEDRVALRWLLGYGAQDWRTKTYRRLMNYVVANGSSPWTAMNQLVEGTISIPHTASLIARFRVINAELEALSADPDLDAFISAWLPQSDATKLLAETVAAVKEAKQTPRELYDALYDAITEPEMPLEVTEVRIMSLHKSKGLSSPYVFIMGCVEGLLPPRPDPKLSLAKQAAKLEEDRRLFYVGITRVKADLENGKMGYLAITYSRTMVASEAHHSQIVPAQTRGGVAYLQASRFISEMAPHAPEAKHNQPL